MKVLITGTSSGIGKAIAEKFLKENHQVIGLDIKGKKSFCINFCWKSRFHSQSFQNHEYRDFPLWLSGKESAGQCRRLGFNP